MEFNTLPVPSPPTKSTADNAEKSSIHSSSDVEKQIPGTTNTLHRTLKGRHLQLIAVGGTVGTGIFIASGTSLSTAGPAGALIGYAFVGTIVYVVTFSLAELSTAYPLAGSFTQHASRFVDPSLGFALGWIYWFSWAITYALELTAAGLVMQYWTQKVSIGVWIAIFWVPITALNFLPVNVYAECEVWFASIKVIALAGFAIFAICINAGAGDDGYIGFRYWRTPGAFAPYPSLADTSASSAGAKAVGCLAVLIQAGFAYQGTELVGVGAGESENPGKTMPSAIRRTFWTILSCFISTIFFIGILVPYNNEALLTGTTNAAASPLVIAAKLAGVKALPDIINAILLTVVLSAALSNVYSGSRILIALADSSSAPACLSKTNRRGVPIYAVAFTSAFGLLGFMNLSNNGGEVFNWFLNIIAVAGFIAWACICGSHIAFMRALKVQNRSRADLPYRAPCQPYAAWYGLVWCVIIIFGQGFTAFLPWSTKGFFVAYVSLILFAVAYGGHKIVTRTGFVKAHDVDLDDGRWIGLGTDSEEEGEKAGWRKMLARLH
ncbi:histidine permease [Mytilinidion resinicola]|uniref:Histidine permease n=1 Tax=Mytilinidion resinicola TaxID=574789 RepID=A0A6A6XZS2_9PEZI|nr:histidine permease [Mytilinidion resinicola]KAF2802061.1 histidine permease [Mytilinidion resinicola]